MESLKGVKAGKFVEERVSARDAAMTLMHE